MDIIFAIIKWLFAHWVIIIMTIVALFIWFVLWVIKINKQITEERRREEEERRRKFYTCDKCGKEWALVEGRTEEVDRYPTYKEVSERTSSGKLKTRQVKILKVKEVTHWKCKFCDAGFTTTKTRELK